MNVLEQLDRYSARLEDEINELENKIIELSADLGMYQNENENLTKDIEKYWGIEQELGCPLEVVFEVLKQGYIYVYDNHYNFDDYTKTKAKITFNNGKFYIGFARNTRRLEDYQKTWWLKGEK